MHFASQVEMFAPDVEMMHVVNHCEGKPGTDTRNVLQESARIARGDVTDLVKLDVGTFDALIIPGDQTPTERDITISTCLSFDVCCFIISL